MIMEIIISVILLIVGVAVLVIIHVCVVGRAFRGDSINGRNSIPTRDIRIPSMNIEDILELPCFEYKLEGNENRNIVDCTVCLDGFKSGEKCRILPKCDHIFHAECIDSWLLKTGACPICRTSAKLQVKLPHDLSSGDTTHSVAGHSLELPRVISPEPMTNTHVIMGL